MTAPTPQWLLKRAADILDERGWHQGGFVGPTGCVCVLGAINIAAAECAGVEIDRSAINGQSLPRESWGLRNDALEALVPVRGPHPQGVGGWNDAPRQTATRVKAALLRAAGGDSR